MKHEDIFWLYFLALFSGPILAGVYLVLRAEKREIEKNRCEYEALMTLADDDLKVGGLRSITIDLLYRLASKIEVSGRHEIIDLADNCYRILQRNGEARAYHLQATLLRRRLTPFDKVAQLERKGAELGCRESMYAISWMLKRGEGVMKNYQESFDWLLKAAYLACMRSMEEVADAYIKGEIVPANPIEGLAWYMVARENGNRACITKIDAIERGASTELQVAAQNRARVILQAIRSGGVSPATTTASSPTLTPSKPASQPRGSGSGAIVSKSGHVVTAQHVIKGAGYVEVVTPSGTYPAKVLFADEANDLAVLKVDQSFDRHLNVLHSRSIRLGAKVSTIGFPNIGLQGHSPKATEGVISSDLGFQNDVRMWQVSVPIQPGNSGGPLLDEAGHVVGVVVASLSLNAVKVTGAVPQNVNYAIKSAYLEPMLGGCQVDLIQTPVAEARRLEDIMESARQASVLILTY